MMTHVRNLAVAGALVGCLVSPAWADFQSGLAAYKSGNYAAALKEWRPLAEQGHAKAQHNLGVMYENGRGVPQDYAEARRWYQKAAEQGQVFAQNNLGKMYERGPGVPQDYVQADMWYILSAAQGNEVASRNHAAITKKMTPAQIAEAQKNAREWKPKK